MTSTKEVFGMLAVIITELPCKTKAQQEKLDELKRTYKTAGFIGRFATDWGFLDYKNTMTQAAEDDPTLKPSRPVPALLKSGDFIKIFKTVSDGEVLWQDTIRFDKNYTTQAEVDPEKWERMFFDNYPARLERNGKTVFGALEPFSQPGADGLIWCVREYGKTGADSPRTIMNGDNLTIYKSVRNGDVQWQGTLGFEAEKAEMLGDSEILRRPNHMDAAVWRQIVLECRPVALTPR